MCVQLYKSYFKSRQKYKMKNIQDQDQLGENSLSEDSKKSKCCNPGRLANFSLLLNFALCASLIALFCKIKAMSDTIALQSVQLDDYSTRIDLAEKAKDPQIHAKYVKEFIAIDEEFRAFEIEIDGQMNQFESNTQASLGQLETQSTSIVSKADGIKATTANFTSKFEELETETSAMQIIVDDLVTNTTNFESKISSIETKQNSVSSKANTHASEIDVLQD